MTALKYCGGLTCLSLRNTAAIMSTVVVAVGKNLYLSQGSGATWPVFISAPESTWPVVVW